MLEGDWLFVPQGWPSLCCRLQDVECDPPVGSRLRDFRYSADHPVVENAPLKIVSVRIAVCDTSDPD